MWGPWGPFLTPVPAEPPRMQPEQVSCAVDTIKDNQLPCHTSFFIQRARHNQPASGHSMMATRWSKSHAKSDTPAVHDLLKHKRCHHLPGHSIAQDQLWIVWIQTNMMLSVYRQDSTLRVAKSEYYFTDALLERLSIDSASTMTIAGTCL